MDSFNTDRRRRTLDSSPRSTVVSGGFLPWLRVLIALAFLVGSGAAAVAAVVETDVCVYGGTSGGIASAIQVARMGKTVSLAVFDSHLGGLTSGGLGATDVGRVPSIGGIAREFYQRAGRHYGLKETFVFEPHVASDIYAAWLKETGVEPRWNHRLASVQKSGDRITQITMEDGTVYRARMFIDATYEGDLLAMAGVSFTFGRESVATFGESLNGIREKTPKHQFAAKVDPYVVPGNPASGLLPFIQPGDGGRPGDGDVRIQAYNFRLCFTQNPTNRRPNAVPPNYDPARFELLGRLLDAEAATGTTPKMADFLSVRGMPNGKTDMNNNGPFSTDYLGMNWTYPTNTYVERARMDREHLEYIQGLIHFLETSPRSPASLRHEIGSWGPCRDEWQDTGGYSSQIYVREARRMVSDYVVTQADCLSRRVPEDSVCLGSYNMDSHNIQRVVKDGFAINEGDVQIGVPRPYPISYRSIVPKAGECGNLFVTFALSATHIAFGSTRMEPVFMMAGQSAATAAVLAIDDGVTVQKVDYAKLAARLVKDGQILTWGSGGDASAEGIILDERDRRVVLEGRWEGSHSIEGFWGDEYLHDLGEGKGTKSVTYRPNLPSNGVYSVQMRWTASDNRAKRVPVDVVHPGGTTTIHVDQTMKNGQWATLLTTNFVAGTNAVLRLRTGGTTGHVVADAVRWLPVSNGKRPD
jgi:hypothetical protein